MIDLRQLLAVLASRMPWQQIEACVSHLMLRRTKAGEALPKLGLFGEQVARLARASNAGRPCTSKARWRKVCMPRCARRATTSVE